MRFATQVLLLQLATVIAVVATCIAVFALLGVQQLRQEAQQNALAIARTVAKDADVRSTVAGFSESMTTPSAAELRGGTLEALASDIRASTGALFVVITDDKGIRLSHPNADLLGQRVSTSFKDALASRESVSWERGTLGESARAKVPVFAPESSKPVGEVSVGFAPATVFSQAPLIALGIGAAAALAVVIGASASALIRRRLVRLTFGLQPEELRALVQQQAAVLNGVGEGVIAFSSTGTVTLCNDQAAEMLGIVNPVGRSLGELGVVGPIADALASMIEGEPPSSDGAFVVRGRIVYLEGHRVVRNDVDLGAVVVIRDRTDLASLSERLNAVGTMANALRAQRHEFANAVHVASGLIDASRAEEARTYLGRLSSRGPLKYPVEHADRLQEPYLQALVGAKGIEAAERGVLLTIGEGTTVAGTITDPEDVATVLGNLVDNAVRAAVDGDEPRWVEIELLDHGDTLFITVADSGTGIDPHQTTFGQSESPAQRDSAAVHGHGFGLPLSRDLARRRGGDLWIIDAGGAGHGAVLCARLPGIIAQQEEQ